MILYYRRIASNNTSTILAKLLAQAKELNVQSQKKDIKCTIIKYKEVIFGVDTPIYTECLNRLQKQQVIDEIVYRKKIEITVRYLAW